MLDIVPSWNAVQYQGKLMMQTWENGKKPKFRPNFGSPKNFLWLLPLLVIGDSSKLSSYDSFKSNFGSFGSHLDPQSFLWLLPLLDARHCCKLSSYSIWRKTYDPNSRKWWKTSFWAWFRPVGPKFGPPKKVYKTSSYKLLQAIILCKLKENSWTTL